MKVSAGEDFLTHNSVLPRSSQAVHTSVGSTIIAEANFHSTLKQQIKNVFQPLKIKTVGNFPDFLLL